MNKKLLWISTLLCLLPIAVGFILSPALPSELATHWNAAGEIDGTMPKIAAIIGLPLFLAAIHLFTLFMVHLDPKQKGKNQGILQYLYWFSPVLCLICMSAIYLTALGYSVNVSSLIFAAVSLSFVGIGHLLKKVEPNYTIGLRLPWTLDNAENWNRTHQFASPVWMVCGGIMLLASFTPFASWVLLIVLPIMILAPMIYSYWLYRR